MGYKHKKISKSAGDKVIEALEYDDLIHNEKIGTSKYIWAFKSEKSERTKNELQKMEQNLGDINVKIVEMERRLEAAKKARVKPEEERNKEMAALELMNNQILAMKDQIKQNKGVDPEEFDKIVAATEVCKEGAERWTDNVFGVIKLLTTKG